MIALWQSVSASLERFDDECAKVKRAKKRSVKLHMRT